MTVSFSAGFRYWGLGPWCSSAWWSASDLYHHRCFAGPFVLLWGRR